jgi:hypothetical protein
MLLKGACSQKFSYDETFNIATWDCTVLAAQNGLEVYMHCQQWEYPKEYYTWVWYDYVSWVLTLV